MPVCAVTGMIVRLIISQSAAVIFIIWSDALVVMEAFGRDAMHPRDDRDRVRYGRPIIVIPATSKAALADQLCAPGNMAMTSPTLAVQALIAPSSVSLARSGLKPSLSSLAVYVRPSTV